ncbi:MAG: 16S rRNA (guanine(966)-N(2))-methyltransferase RsmD [Candidatus Coproplasma sp.]
MRIISGKHRGRKLVEFTAEGIRPTSDRAKESLFNILSYKIVGATVLDLFCGSGSIGLECVSRGADKVCFNDKSASSVGVLKKNISLLKEESRCCVTVSDYKDYLNGCNEKFDIIFLDPPYAEDFGIPALNVISQRGLLNEGGVAIYERDRAFEGEVEGLEKVDERKYGKAYLTFFKATGKES